MASVFYIHWNAEEASETAACLREGGHDVTVESASGDAAWKRIKEAAPEVLVVSLERLPSHGRQVAAAVRQTKAGRAIRLVFVGGEPANARATRDAFPDAEFCMPDALPGVLGSGVVPSRPESAGASRKPR
jgi:CheY-like chemotaxis protein